MPPPSPTHAASPRPHARQEREPELQFPSGGSAEQRVLHRWRSLSLSVPFLLAPPRLRSPCFCCLPSSLFSSVSICVNLRPQQGLVQSSRPRGAIMALGNGLIEKRSCRLTPLLSLSSSLPFPARVYQRFVRTVGFARRATDACRAPCSGPIYTRMYIGGFTSQLIQR